jgi:glycosyltransferase involved in cell wall biosynthesis
MPRVLLVHGNSEWYGSDRSLVLLARALRKRGWDVAASVPGAGQLEDRLHEAGIEVHHVDPGALRGRVYGPARLLRYVAIDLPRSALRVRRLARSFDVVHVNASIFLGGIVGGFLARRPVVLHVRETYQGSERLWRAYARMVHRLVDQVVAISDGIRVEVEATALRDRVTMIHNGLDFGPLPAPTGDGPVVALGRINDWKGHDVLIEAVDVLRTRGLVVAVEIAGDTYPGQEHLLVALKELAEARGVSANVRFLGYVEDVDGLMRRAAIFVQPSIKPEPFGLSLAEALGYGLACIGTDAGGPRDMIRPGVTGLLVPPGDSTALADAIEHLWRDASLRRQLGGAAAVDVRERFSIDATGSRIADLYDTLLA